jgi:two-component system KDP operon response regulator KdpE
MNTVLLRDSDRDLLGLVRLALHKSDWRIAITDAEHFTLALDSEMPDVVLIDVDRGGAEELLRAGGDAPCIVIAMTKNTSEARSIKWLATGADGVYVLPLAPHLLRARLHAIVRCIAKHDQPSRNAYVFEHLVIDLREPHVTFNGKALHLSSTEHRLLQTLALHAGRTLSHDQLLRTVWGEGYEGGHELLRTFVSNLRRRLRAAGLASDLIHTKRQAGYWIPRMPRPRAAVAHGSSLAETSLDAGHVRARTKLLSEWLEADAKTAAAQDERLRATLGGMVEMPPQREPAPAARRRRGVAKQKRPRLAEGNGTTPTPSANGHHSGAAAPQVRLH